MAATRISGRVAYIISEESVKIASLLPSNRNRSLLVHTLVISFGLLSAAKQPHAVVTRLARAIKSDLTEYHDTDFIEFMLNPERTASAEVTSDHINFGLEDDCPAFRGLPLYILTIGGGALTAARVLRAEEPTTDIAIFWDGGRFVSTHHAQKGSASGFCYVADGVLTILALARPLSIPKLPTSQDEHETSGQAVLRRPRVMYLDLDVHFGDGVAAAFHRPGRGRSGASSNILTLSIHYAAPGFFPKNPLADLPRPLEENDDGDRDWDPYTLSVPLGIGTSCVTMARIWRSVVEAVRSAFAPDFLVIQCGADGLAGDPCGVWNWSSGGEGDGSTPEDGSMGWCVQQACSWGCKVLLTGGGGYNSPNVARTYAYLTSIALASPIRRTEPIPDHAHYLSYAPSFTIDVPPGNMRDQNTQDNLWEIERLYAGIAQEIERRRTMFN